VAAQKSADHQPGRVDLEKWGAEGLPNLQPLWMLKYLPNMLASHVSILQDARGPNNTITENEVASLLALSEATRIIQRDLADFFLVGGADSRLDPLSFVRHSMFMPLSQRNDSPAAACRPFDRGRDGVVIGEGSAVFALEELEHARRRNAKIYAEVVGMASAFDRGRSGTGIARMVRTAFEQAGVGPKDIDHINAHGASDIDGDRWEARGLAEALGPASERVPVFAPSSYMGSLGAGGSMAELTATVLAMEERLLPPTLNYEVPDPECAIRVTAKGLSPVRFPHVLKLSLTDLGQCACVILRKL
jgi:3-oxoacyl-[acyl-carrier-protein] synthase II